MNDVIGFEDYYRATLNKDTNAEKANSGRTSALRQILGRSNSMSVANITYQDLKTKDDIKIDCEIIQKKIPEIREVYYKKENNEIELFIFFEEINFKIRNKIFDEIVELRNKYNNYFDFKAFTIDFDREVIERGMERLL